MHLLLRRHGICALLGSLLLLEIRLILERLLLVGGHVGLLGLVARHALLHVVGHGGWGSVLLFGGFHSGAIAIDVVGVGGLGGVQAGLEREMSVDGGVSLVDGLT